jgi:hypothetical protein
LRAASAFAALAGPRLAWWSSTARDEASWLSTMAINSSDEGLSEDSADALLSALHDVAHEPFPALQLAREASPDQPLLLEVALGSSTIDNSAWADVLDWMFYANVPVEQAEVAGFIRVHIPAHAMHGNQDGAQWLRTFMRACVDVMPVLHGTAGWSLQLPLSYRYFHANMYAAVALFDVVKAHAGVDVYDPAEMAIAFTERCPAANWMSYLGRIAPPDAIAGALANAPSQAQGLVVEAFGSGLLVQAGPMPSLLHAWYPANGAASAAARQQDPSLTLYRAAAALLRPWRVTDSANECIAPPPYGYADEAQWRTACDQYLTRFD